MCTNYDSSVRSYCIYNTVEEQFDLGFGQWTCGDREGMGMDLVGGGTGYEQCGKDRVEQNWYVRGQVGTGTKSYSGVKL